MENPINNGRFGGKTHYFRKHPYRIGIYAPEDYGWNTIPSWRCGSDVFFFEMGDGCRFHVNLPGCIYLVEIFPMKGGMTIPKEHVL